MSRVHIQEPRAINAVDARGTRLQARWCVLDAFGWSGSGSAQNRVSEFPQRVLGVFGARGPGVPKVVEPGLGCRWHKPLAMLAPACPEGAESARPQHPRCSVRTPSRRPHTLQCGLPTEPAPLLLSGRGRDGGLRRAGTWCLYLLRPVACRPFCRCAARNAAPRGTERPVTGRVAGDPPTSAPLMQPLACAVSIAVPVASVPMSTAERRIVRIAVLLVTRGGQSVFARGRQATPRLCCTAPRGIKPCAGPGPKCRVGQRPLPTLEPAGRRRSLCIASTAITRR